jgi:hypothetical protein
VFAARGIGLNNIELHNLGNRHKINNKKNGNKMSSVLIWQLFLLLSEFNVFRLIYKSHARSLFCCFNCLIVQFNLENIKSLKNFLGYCLIEQFSLERFQQTELGLNESECSCWDAANILKISGWEKRSKSTQIINGDIS